MLNFLLIALLFILLAFLVPYIFFLRKIKFSVWDRERSNLLMAALEAAANGIVITDRNGCVIWVNKAFTDLTGYSPDGIIGRKVNILKSGKHDISFYKNLWDTVLSGQVWQGEIINRRKDGTLYVEEMTITPVLNRQGEITNFVAIKQDVSERKRLEEERKQAEKEKIAILDSMSELVVYLDTEMKVMWVNRAAAESVSSSAQDMVGRHCYDIWHFRGEPCVGCPVVKAIDTGQPSESEVVSPDGRVWFIRGNPVRDSAGKIIGAVDVGLDITAQKKAEEALQETEERFREIFEQNGDAVILFRYGTNQIVDANPAALELYGFNREELFRYGHYLFLEPKGIDEFELCLSSANEVERIHRGRRVNIRKDGSKIVVTYRFKPIQLKKEKVVYCSIRDITEKVRAEEETGLMQAKLIQANKMTSLGLLVSGITHEINNPNSYIMSNASFLYNSCINDIIKILDEYEKETGEFFVGGLPYAEARDSMPRMLSGIIDGSRRVKNIVDEMRSFVLGDRIGASGDVTINRVINAAVSLIGHQIAKYTDNFHLHLGEGLPTVKGSPQQIEQVVINLILNALQALPGRRCGVWVNSSYDSASGCVSIKVRDEGAGMTKEVMEHVTDPFFSTRLDKGGTGLGLSISNSIIKEHRGTLELESEPNFGTLVTVKLPAERNGL